MYRKESTQHGSRGKAFSYTVSQKNVPPLTCYNLCTHSSTATIFGTNVAEKVSNQKVLFPPQLTSASAIPGERGKSEIVSFHLNAACFFTKKHETQLKNISPGQSWTTFHCQDLGKEHSIVLCVTHMLCVSQVRHSVSCCVKVVSCSSSSLDWKSMDSINGISYYLNKC